MILMVLCLLHPAYTQAEERNNGRFSEIVLPFDSHKPFKFYQDKNLNRIELEIQDVSSENIEIVISNV